MLARRGSLLVPWMALATAAAAQDQWRGFERRDLQIDGRACTVVAPREAAPGRPWIWRARFFGHEPQTDLALLSRGFHLVYMDVANLYGNPSAVGHWDACYRHVTAEFGLSGRVALEGMSRGGLIVFNWAAKNAARVACIYADAPVLDIRSWPGGQGKGRGSAADWSRCLAAHGLTEATARDFAGSPVDTLGALAKAGVPILCVCGADDAVVPIEENARVAEKRYRALGGRIRVIAKAGVGHHPHSLADPTPIVDFILRHTVGSGDYFVLRGGLQNSRARFVGGGRARVAFLGGSITHNPGWRELVCRDLAARFPKAELDFVNAGIPSFGSTPGAFRLGRDVLSRGSVDLLFVEAAVNDSINGRTSTEQLRGMEGIVWHARAVNPSIDVVMMHFVDPAKMKVIRNGLVPEVIATHERVAEHYGVASIDLALEVTERIDAGEFTWKDDFVNLHPSPFGQRLYAGSIERLLDAAWAGEPEAARPLAMPAPLDPHSYARGRYAPIQEARLGPGWRLEKEWRPSDRAGTRAGFVGVPMLVAERPGAVLEYAFEGTAIGILVAAGPDSGVVEFRVDDRPFAKRDLFTRWSRGLHLPWSYVLETELPPGQHKLELRLAKDAHPKSSGTAARIVHFLVNDAR